MDYLSKINILQPNCGLRETSYVIYLPTEDNARIMVEERCIVDVVNALERHIQSVPLVAAASITLMSLLLEGRQTCSVVSFWKVGKHVLWSASGR